jgi:cytoskeletal protein CcmA (bactofilin family)
VVLGDLRFSGTVDVEGLIQGNLIAENGKEALVRVVEKGRVEGEIRCPAVIINGEVEGDVYASRHLELAARARVKGNVFYALMEMAAGSEVNGSMSHMPEQDATQPDAAPSAAAGSPRQS